MAESNVIAIALSRIAREQLEAADFATSCNCHHVETLARAIGRLSDDDTVRRLAVLIEELATETANTVNCMAEELCARPQGAAA